MLTHEELMRYALAKSKKLTEQDFKRRIEVEHVDGSHYYVSHGCVEKIVTGSIVIVYNQYGSPMIFKEKDVKIIT